MTERDAKRSFLLLFCYFVCIYTSILNCITNRYIYYELNVTHL